MSKLVFKDTQGGEIEVVMNDHNDIVVTHTEGSMLGFEFTLAEIRQIAAWAKEEEWA